MRFSKESFRYTIFAWSNNGYIFRKQEASEKTDAGRPGILSGGMLMAKFIMVLFMENPIMK